jgi:hypothetical protein
MKCPYVKQLICDYPVSTGDIICTTCPHYPHRRESKINIDIRGSSKWMETANIGVIIHRPKSFFQKLKSLFV